MKLAVVMPTIHAHGAIKLSIESLSFCLGGFSDERQFWANKIGSGGFSKNVNDGIKYVRSWNEDLDGILVVNDDIVCLTPHLAERIDASLQMAKNDHPRVAALGFMSNFVMEHQRTQAIPFLGPPELVDVPVLSFFCVYLSCAALDDVGLLDEDYGYGQWEDTDWCYRAKMKGWALLLDRSIFVYHWGSQSLKTKPDHVAKYHENEAIFRAKHGLR